VRQGKLEAQGYAPATFDAVTMSHFLEHVYDADAPLEESHRILKPGGRLVVVTPNAAAWGHRLFGRAWRGLEPPRHLQIFTPEALRSALERAGFRQSIVRTSIHSRLFMLQQSLIIARRDAEARGSSVPAWTVLMGMWYRLAARPRMIRQPDGGEEIVALATR
jgi:SAM-dependent methyltransferase